jgi:hypothetical protein
MIAVEAFVAMIDYLSVEISAFDTVAAHCLAMARESLLQFAARQAQSVDTPTRKRRQATAAG